MISERTHSFTYSPSFTGETPYDVAENYHVIKQYLLPLQFKYMNNEVTTPPAAYGIQTTSNNGYIPSNQPMNYNEISNNTETYSDPPTLFVDPKVLNSYRVSPSNSSNNIVVSSQLPPPPPPTVAENSVEASSVPVVKKVVTSAVVPPGNTIKKAEIVKNPVFNNNLSQPVAPSVSAKPVHEASGPSNHAVPAGPGISHVAPAVPPHDPLVPPVVNTGAPFVPALPIHNTSTPIPAAPIHTGATFIPTGGHSVPSVPAGTNIMVPNGAINPPVVPAVVSAPKIVPKTIVPANDGFYSSTTDPQLQAKYGHNIEIKRTGIHSPTHSLTHSLTHLRTQHHHPQRLLLHQRSILRILVIPLPVRVMLYMIQIVKRSPRITAISSSSNRHSISHRLHFLVPMHFQLQWQVLVTCIKRHHYLTI